MADEADDGSSSAARSPVPIGVTAEEDDAGPGYAHPPPARSCSSSKRASAMADEADDASSPAARSPFPVPGGGGVTAEEDDTAPRAPLLHLNMGEQFQFLDDKNYEFWEENLNNKEEDPAPLSPSFLDNLATLNESLFDKDGNIKLKEWQLPLEQADSYNDELQVEAELIAPPPPSAPHSVTVEAGLLQFMEEPLNNTEEALAHMSSSFVDNIWESLFDEDDNLKELVWPADEPENQDAPDDVAVPPIQDDWLAQARASGEFTPGVADRLVEEGRWAELVEYLETCVEHHTPTSVLPVAVEGTPLVVVHAELFLSAHRPSVLELVAQNQNNDGVAAASAYFAEHLTPLQKSVPQDRPWLRERFALLAQMIYGFSPRPSLAECRQEAVVEIRDYMFLYFTGIRPLGEPVRGKAQSPLWRFGEKVVDERGRTGFRCFSCHTVYWGCSVGRLQTHLQGGSGHQGACPAVLPCIRQILQAMLI